MFRNLLMGAAALTLMSGAALAQNGYSTTTTVTRTTEGVTNVEPARRE